MARIPFADEDRLGDASRAALAALPDLGIFRLLANAGPAFPDFIRLTATLWNDAELSPRRRELAILLVAQLTDCEYEWHQHEEVARLCGITDAEIGLLRSADLAGFDDGERAMLEFVRVTVDRGRASDEHFAVVRGHLTSREVVELQLIVAVYSGLAAIMVGLDLELDPASGASALTRDERGPRLGS